jgi:hypothetical protein
VTDHVSDVAFDHSNGGPSDNPADTTRASRIEGTLPGLGEAIGVMTPEQRYLGQDALRTLWILTMGGPTTELPSDLAALHRWFDPVAQGNRLRRDLATLPPPPQEWRDPGPPWTCAASGPRRLVTPEGRCLLHLMDEVGNDSLILVDTTRPIELLLLQTYREWNRHRLDSVVALLDGDNKPLQISAAGVVLALLVNRCTSRERALTRFADGSAKNVVDEAFFDAVSAFATSLSPQRRGTRAGATLISGWMLYEAARRIGDGLVIVDARGGKDGAVWIEDGATDHVLSVVARDLARGHRSKVTGPSLGVAFDALVDALRDRMPKLAGYRLAHERPVATAQLRQALLAAFDRALGGTATP